MIIAFAMPFIALMLAYLFGKNREELLCSKEEAAELSDKLAPLVAKYTKVENKLSPEVVFLMAIGGIYAVKIMTASNAAKERPQAEPESRKNQPPPAGSGPQKPAEPEAQTSESFSFAAEPAAPGTEKEKSNSPKVGEIYEF